MHRTVLQLAALAGLAAAAFAQPATTTSPATPTNPAKDSKQPATSNGKPGGKQGVKVDAAIADYKPVEGITGTVKSIGSDSMINLMTAWSEDFKKFYPSVQTEIEGKGSGTAPPALIENQAQFGPMSRPMKADEIKKFEDKFGYKPTEIRTAVDTLAVFVHKDNPLEEISLEQIAKVYSVKGPDMTWGDLGVTGDLAGQPIALYGRNSASGTYGYFKERALSKSDFKNSVKEQPGSSAVVQAVGTDAAGIGYSGVGYLTADVKVLKVRATPKSKAVAPTVETALNGQYPIARYLSVYVNKAPGESLDPLRAEFIKLMLSRQGQETVIKDGYFPVPAKTIAEDLKKLGLTSN
ncbi:MAG TPA: phosphate ABC transporter substrate-binding protein [Phycisphaerales bacterium]|nr:phosphate ABC transporter substrate-binding protein [Phycisphaerales bacterium]